MTSEPDVDANIQLIMDLRVTVQRLNDELANKGNQLENMQAELLNCMRFLGIIKSSRIKISKKFWDESPLVFGTVGTDSETGHMVIIAA